LPNNITRANLSLTKSSAEELKPERWIMLLVLAGVPHEKDQNACFFPVAGAMFLSY
jgi:hypothetical protein